MSIGRALGRRSIGVRGGAIVAPCRARSARATLRLVATTGHRLSAARRDGGQVSSLELFFDLVFVLAFTQTSGLMEDGHSWAAMGEGLLVLGVLWWTWVGYAWLTSVVDPDAGLCRLVVFVAMAGTLVVALCVPEAFGDRALLLAAAYAVVRAAHIVLFWMAGEGDRELRRSVAGLAVGATIGVGLIVVAAFLDGWVQPMVWLVALLVDMGVPFLFGSEGWHLVPSHFVERHGLIVILALGESIVALGVASRVDLTGSVIAASVVGLALAAAMWWSYFDVHVLLAERRLVAARVGKEQNEMARDGFSFLHLPIVAGIVLVAVGTHAVLAHLSEHLDTLGATALAGGLAVFLAGQVGFKIRVVGLLSPLRMGATVLALGLIPVALAVPAWLALVLATALAWGLVTVETFHFADLRAEVRQHRHDEATAEG
jgi:low temperature requirement protein LtrA